MFRFSGILLLLLPLLSAAQKEKLPQMTIPEYITKYSELAKAEMRRTGIPASITLAQGIIESSYGNSDLAVKANNHFGIKCGSNWKGPTFIQDDDVEKECFRKYESVLHSYADHSNFLKGKERYASLFELDPKNYKGWANGLQKAGYATNPNYGSQLIFVIEGRELHQFDLEEKNATVSRAEAEYFASVNNKSYRYNGVLTVIAQPNEMMMDIATKYDVSLNVLLKYNDMSEGDHPERGTKVYLEPKKSKGYEPYHRVDKGETMYSISQKQCIKLKALYKKNLMTWGQEPAEGEVLCLQKKCGAIPKLKTDEQMKEDIKEKIQTRVDEAVKEDQERENPGKEEAVVGGVQIEEKPAEPVAAKPVAKAAPVAVAVQEAPVAEEKPAADVAPKEKHAPKKETPASKAAAAAAATTVAATPAKAGATKKTQYHTVAPQETLYKIATSYGLTVDQLKQLNGLTSNSISIGQKLVVGSAATPAVETVTEKPAAEKTVAEKPVDTEKTTVAEKTVVVASVAAEKPAGQPLIEEKQPIYHTVAPQETLYQIASKYSVSVAELKVINELHTSELTTGQKLLVGYKGVSSTQPVETAEDRADAPPQVTPNDQPSYHKVQPGETLFAIAQKYNIDVEELKTLNKLSANDIQTGRILKLR